MADESDVSKVVTTFLLNTCRLPPWPRTRDAQAAMFCGLSANMRLANDEDAEYIPLITGSAAEFCIEPMLPHVGDIDVMCYCNCLLAIPRGHPPPTQLPAEFHNYVKVWEIIDSHLPGYVYLELRYLLTHRSDEGTYKLIQYDGGQWLYFDKIKTVTPTLAQIHGPALQLRNTTAD